jgi:hypothetical protein
LISGLASPIRFRSINWAGDSCRECHLGFGYRDLAKHHDHGKPQQLHQEEVIGYWNKDTLFEHNIVVTTDNGSSVAALPFQYSWYSYPDTDTITANTFYSVGTYSCTPSSGNCRAIYIDPSTITTLTPGTYTFTQMQALPASFTDSTYANSNFRAASETPRAEPGHVQLQQLDHSRLLQSSLGLRRALIARVIPWCR